MAQSKKTELDFESSLSELTQLVEQMEQGGLSLEQSLESFERGIKLVRHCQSALQTAEQKVQILMEKNGKLESLPYQSEAEE
jgi:exodeoxyribonuclease VII small subunit